LTDNGSKLDAETKTAVEKAITDAKEAKEGDNLDTIVAAKDALSQASMKIGQAIYGSGNNASEGEGETKKEDDNTVDADFKEKSDKKEDDTDDKKKP